MKNYYIVLTLLCVILLASCGTKKQAVSTPTVQMKPTYVTSPISLSFLMGDKNVSVGGTLRMKRDDVIQISLVTFGILEVGRIEMTPDYFMVIDKMNRQYVKAAYGDVPFLKDANIDFRTIQSYFWDEQTSSHVNWERTEYVSLEGWKFPTRHAFVVSNGSKSIKVTLSLSNLKSEGGWETRTDISGRSYKEITVEKLLSLITSLSK